MGGKPSARLWGREDQALTGFFVSNICSCVYVERKLPLFVSLASRSRGILRWLQSVGTIQHYPVEEANLC